MAQLGVAMTSGVFWSFFALTVLVEVPVYGLLLVRFGGVGVLRALLTALAVNLLVYPLFVVVLVPAAGAALPALAAIAAAEVAVCVLEAGLVRWWLRTDTYLAAAASLLANGGSVVAGGIVVVLT